MAYSLRSLRDYDEHDVLNLFSYDTTGLTAGAISVSKGILVKIATGWKNHDNAAELGGGLEFVGGAGTFAPANVVSQRFGVTAKVVANGLTDTPVGMMLFDVKDADENGELLKFNPRKAAEMQAAIPGQAVPVVTRGVFLVGDVGGTPATAGIAYSAANGLISATSGVGAVIVGKFLGPVDSNGDTLVKLAL